MGCPLAWVHSRRCHTEGKMGCPLAMGALPSEPLAGTRDVMSRVGDLGGEMGRADAHQMDAHGSRAAAFFDLDRTLMAGSSGIFFARAAYEAGMITRGRLLSDLYQNLRFRLRGSTDDWADEVRRRVGEMLAGVAVRDLQRMSPLERAYAHQDAGRPVYIVTAASQEMADLLAHVLVFDGGVGSRLEVRDGLY